MKGAVMYGRSVLHAMKDQVCHSCMRLVNVLATDWLIVIH